MRRVYSRLASIEERKNLRKATIFVILSILLLILLFFVGIPLLGKFAGFVSDLKKSGAPISSNDTTPPAPPRFDATPDFTNNKQITITGTDEPGSTIKLTFNDTTEEALSDKDGKFSFEEKLIDGENTFSAIAIDTSGNSSQKSNTITIVFDNKAPDLKIDSPSDGSSFFGSKQRQVTIQGTTEPGCQVMVNGRILVVDSAGKFQYSLTLNDGENKLAVNSLDQAGNSTEVDLTLSFTP